MSKVAPTQNLDFCSVLMDCKYSYFEINSNKTWVEIGHCFLHTLLLKSSMFYIVKYKIWAGLLSKDAPTQNLDFCSVLMVCKYSYFEIISNKNWVEIGHCFLHTHILKSSMFHIVKYENWAG
jgi:hypothetical protein